jgi:hypothetical protein
MLDTLTRIRNTLVKLGAAPLESPQQPHAEARMLDSIAENAVALRARVEGMSPDKARRLLKRVRKALGYTYP